MTTDLHVATCPTCQAPNGAGVKFCAQCGTPLVSAAAAKSPVPPAPVVPSPTAPASVPRPAPADGWQHVRNVLTNAQATITGGDGQSALEFVVPDTSAWSAGPLRMYYTGTITATSNGHPPYTLTVRMLPKSVALLGASWLIGVVVAGFLPRSVVSNDMYIGWIVLSIPCMLWIAYSFAPKRERRRLEALLNGDRAPTATTANAAMPAPPAAANDVFAQLEQLAALQATGLLTAEEVATKKADLLKRI